MPRNDRVVCDVQRCHCEEWSDSGMTWQSRVDECVRSDDTNMVIRDCRVVPPRNDRVVWNDKESTGMTRHDTFTHQKTPLYPEVF